MQVILLEKIDNLGGLGDLVNVKPGFGRNYLIPQGKAKSATKDNIAEINERRAELEAAQTEALAAAKQRAEAMAESKITIKSRAGSEGKLFGSIGSEQISTAISEQLSVAVERKEIRLPEGPLRSIGEHEISIHLHTEVDATVIVDVVVEEE